ncbi:MAG: SusC/RagA family TonB-linked outer membrane protein [Paludibacter sp.]|jgi:TonB-linked SusC/RagA family outer membrane protein|nr:SusC/RagA family TonB-linked outer membrane protein [Paludibacter sp.]
MKYLFNIGKIVVLLLILCHPVANMAQQQAKILVRGTVVSAEDKQPVIGATIMETNADNRVVASAITNLDGNFSIYISDKKNKLVISYVGYKKYEITIGENTAIKVSLQESSSLQEIVVSAKAKQSVGNMDIEERDISMAISRLSSEDIADLQVASIDEAMQGRMAGVDIVANAGDPGSGMSIRIRGITSLNGDNQPLIVVDGIPLETSIGANFDLSTATEEEFSQLLNVAPSDIKEIVVLKDAAANAIWGSKAANGVLQITTIRGSIAPPTVSLRVAQSYKPMPSSIPRLNGNQYSTMLLESFHNAGLEFNLLQNPELAYDPNNPYYYYNYSQNTDWVNAVSQTGWVQDYNVSVRGGSQKVRYSFSAGYYDDKGNTIETGFQRINARMNLDYVVSDRLSFKADMAYTHSTTQKNYVPTGNENSDVRSHAYTKMPNQSIYQYDEFGHLTPNYFTPVNNIQGNYPSVFNPLAMALDGRFDITSESILPKLSLIYRPADEWRYTFDVSFQISNDKRKKFLPISATGLSQTDNRANATSDADAESFTIQTFNKLYYTPTKGVFADSYKHRLITLIGLNTYDRTSYSFQSGASNLANPLLQDPSIPARTYPEGLVLPASGSGQQRTMATYVNVNYTLLDRYTVYGNLNLNGDSRFGKNYRFGLFPSLSARYRVSGEAIFKNWKWLDDFSLRYSWGISGKAPRDDYSFYNQYKTYSWTYAGETATYPSNLELRELRWESSHQSNYGINFVAFDYKLNIEAEYYTRNTKNQFLDNVTIPSNSGFSTMDLNFGTIENRGWEISVAYNVYKNKDWNVNLTFNLARNENRITEISEYKDMYSGTWDKQGDYLSRVELGQPVGSFYGYKYNGVLLNLDQTIALDKKGNKIYSINEQGQTVPVYLQFGYPTIQYTFQPGDARYQDINKDGNINYQDIVWLGDYNPLFTGGITPSIRWKQLTFNTVFFFRYGNDVINMTRMELENMAGYNNQSTAVLRRWRHDYDTPTDAPAGLLPRAMYGSSNWNWLASDRFVEDGSFLRWKSLTVRYNFKRQWLSQFHLTELYVYATINNLAVWTNYTGQDPEVGLSGSNPGRDYSRAPVPKTFTLGANVSF